MNIEVAASIKDGKTERGFLLVRNNIQREPESNIEEGWKTKSKFSGIMVSQKKERAAVRCFNCYFQLHPS